ncbi:uncharacterized protein LOC134530702 isoform X2 [Bacillus rossius redtenbacheri]|uniref:uncharacterized protein LOC134530702 isoform X2 n=1 Tax=Bacillus rossius redtenbacheri TaxID=93214 RepID=UPI002FDE30B3
MTSKFKRGKYFSPPRWSVFKMEEPAMETDVQSSGRKIRYFPPILETSNDASGCNVEGSTSVNSTFSIKDSKVSNQNLTFSMPDVSKDQMILVDQENQNLTFSMPDVSKDQKVFVDKENQNLTFSMPDVSKDQTILIDEENQNLTFSMQCVSRDKKVSGVEETTRESAIHTQSFIGESEMESTFSLPVEEDFTFRVPVLEEKPTRTKRFFPSPESNDESKIHTIVSGECKSEPGNLTFEMPSCRSHGAKFKQVSENTLSNCGKTTHNNPGVRRSMRIKKESCTPLPRIQESPQNSKRKSLSTARQNITKSQLNLSGLSLMETTASSDAPDLPLKCFTPSASSSPSRTLRSKESPRHSKRISQRAVPQTRVNFTSSQLNLSGLSLMETSPISDAPDLPLKCFTPSASSSPTRTVRSVESEAFYLQAGVYLETGELHAGASQSTLSQSVSGSDTFTSYKLPTKESASDEDREVLLSASKALRNQRYFHFPSPKLQGVSDDHTVHSGDTESSLMLATGSTFELPSQVSRDLAKMKVNSEVDISIKAIENKENVPHMAKTDPICKTNQDKRTNIKSKIPVPKKNSASKDKFVSKIPVPFQFRGPGHGSNTKTASAKHPAVKVVPFQFTAQPTTLANKSTAQSRAFASHRQKAAAERRMTARCVALKTAPKDREGKTVTRRKLYHEIVRTNRTHQLMMKRKI